VEKWDTALFYYGNCRRCDSSGLAVGSSAHCVFCVKAVAESDAVGGNASRNNESIAAVASRGDRQNRTVLRDDLAVVVTRVDHVVPDLSFSLVFVVHRTLYQLVFVVHRTLYQLVFVVHRTLYQGLLDV
jgi:hypothetical protein